MATPLTKEGLIMRKLIARHQPFTLQDRLTPDRIIEQGGEASFYFLPATGHEPDMVVKCLPEKVDLSERDRLDLIRNLTNE